MLNRITKKDQVTFVDSTGRSRRGVLTKCVHCSKMFPTRRDQEAKYCSRVCCSHHQRQRVIVDCAACGKLLERTPYNATRTKSKLNFCSKQCKDQSQRIGGLAGVVPAHYGTAQHAYRRLFDENELVCRRCDYKEFAPSVDIHHIDEDRDNNERSNLIPLCKCCHQALHWNLWDLEELNGNFRVQ